MSVVVRDLPGTPELFRGPVCRAPRPLVVGARWMTKRALQDGARAMRQGMALPSPDEAVDAYETAVARADERGDARYAAADESSRLTVMGQRRTRLLLAADQADTRAQAASDRRESALTGWARKLAEAEIGRAHV